VLDGETPYPGKERKNEMANRTRGRQIKFYATPEEWAFIRQKMAQAGMTNTGDYLRQMAMKGYIIEVDFSAVKELAKEVGGIGRNINQIAKRINSTDTIYKDDLTEIEGYMEKIWQLLRYTLSSQRSGRR
jgi:hypothetical protein